MKALILAAGYGTRLGPYTDKTPKALFSIAGRPVIDRLIRQLAAAGCSAAIVNTHHLGDRVASFLSEQSYPIPVHVRHESEILGTGGAIRNVEDFWNDQPFIVVNSDVVTDVDFGRAYAIHAAHPYPVTLVLHDDARLNSVQVNPEHFVIGFDPMSDTAAPNADLQQLTFTGIQVLDSKILSLFPPGIFSSSIDAYRRLLKDGEKIRAWIPENVYWKDIGTPERYRQAVLDQMVPEAFANTWPDTGDLPTGWDVLPGDGSDRKWYRLRRNARSLILVDHGIRKTDGPSEADAFIDIGRHLKQCSVPVPDIHLHNRFAGIVILEDLGNRHLQQVVQEAPGDTFVALYEKTIAAQIHMGLTGAEGFDPGWTFQTPIYDRALVLEKECKYFLDAFVRDYLHTDVDFESLRHEFEHLAGRAAGAEPIGFMHRDFQSRNIMVREGNIFFIDFQGGRKGPLAYDLASLLIDPYVALPVEIRSHLLDVACQEISEGNTSSPEQFRRDVGYCALARNLQILGAFGFLSVHKHKPFFRDFIGPAFRTLGESLSGRFENEFPGLRRLYNRIESSLPADLDSRKAPSNASKE